MIIRRLLSAVGMIVVFAAAAQAQPQIVVNGIAGPATLSVSAGSTVTVAIAGGPGNPTDWIALYPTAASDGAYLDWRYLNNATVAPGSGLTDATVTFLLPVVPGDYEFRLFANNGLDRLATSTLVMVTPSTAQLTVNGTAPPTAVSAVAGTHFSVGVTNGPANASDWIGLFAANAADTGHMTWQYLNGSMTLPASGTSAATLTFLVPTSAGSYELRFFAGGGYAHLATSTTLVVSTSAAQLVVNGVAPPTPVTVAAGSIGVVSVSSGPANPADWVALFPVGAPDTGYVDWRYLNDSAVAPANGIDAATLHFSMPTTAGTYEFRFFADNGSGRLATSGTVSVQAAPATIVVNGVSAPTSVSVSPGASLAVAVTGGPGNATDWIALAASGAPDGSYLAWQYLNGTSTPPAQGLTSASLSIAAPIQIGIYELRLFANNSFSRLTTSSGILVSTTPPTVSVTLASPFQGTTFNEPTSISLEATTTVLNGTISKVEFFAGSALIGTATSLPYQVAWSGMSVGDYALTAVATDNLGALHQSTVVGIHISAGSGNSGTLGMPVASLSTGTYGPNLSVSLSASPGATIRYTTDGSTPSASSSIYASSIALSHTVTIRARAFQQDWTPSPVMTETYTIDNTPPVITTLVTPPPNATGWNNTSVTVTFICSDDRPGPISCPAPIMFANEGAGQTATVTAQDGVGNQTSVTLVVNIDRAPAIVSLTSPADGVTTTSSSVTLTGVIGDTLSGIDEVTCNGAAQSPLNGSVSCTVPLRPGINSVVLQASDLAGNSSSKGVRVTREVSPSVLTITPRARRIVVGETKPLVVSAESGVLTSGVVWTSSDSSIASVSDDSSGLITAHVPGEVTITAHSGSLTADAMITVVATVAQGDARWTSEAPLGWVSQSPIYATHIDENGPDLFSVETDAAGEATVVRALRADGTELWTENAPVAPLLGDVFGGIIGYQFVEGPVNGSSTIARFAGPASAQPWTYQSSDSCICAGVVQAPDGTIFFEEEHATDATEAVITNTIVGLDGHTGAVRFRYTLPVVRWSENEIWDPQNCNVTQSGVSDNRPGPLTIGPDGALYLETMVTVNPDEAWSHTWSCPTPIYGAGSFTRPKFQLQMLRLDSDGHSSSVVLREWPQQSGPDSNELFFTYERPWPGSVVPDGLGGVLPTWVHGRVDSSNGTTFDFAQIIDRVIGQTVEEHSRIPTEAFPGSVLSLVGDGTAYLKEGSTLTAIDISTWSTQWTLESNASPVIALADGGVALHDGSVLAYLDVNGNVTASAPLAAMDPSSPIDFSTWYGVNPATGALVATAEPNGNDAAHSFQALLRGPLDNPVGNPQRQGGAAAYRTADAAAIAALRRYVPQSEQQADEYGGSICRQGARFSYGPAKQGEPNTPESVVPAPCAEQFQAVGEYHTHFGNAAQEGPSGGDLDRQWANGLMGFVGVSRDTYVNVPGGCWSVGMGNIWKYLVDRSVPLNTTNPTYRIVPTRIACTPTGH